LCVKILTSWNIPETILNRRRRELIVVTCAIAEVQCFVGVEPKAIKGNGALEVIKVNIPPRPRLILEEVWINDIIRPCLAYELSLTSNLFRDEDL